MKVNKYLYGWKFYLDYGWGWEYELFEETRKGMIQSRKDYRENAPQYPIKISWGREPNPAFQEPEDPALDISTIDPNCCPDCYRAFMIETDG